MPLRVEIFDRVVERGDVILARAVRDQVHRADPALVRELDPARTFVRQEMEVGAMREARAR